MLPENIFINLKFCFSIWSMNRILEPDLFLINFDRNSSWNLSYDFSSLIRVCLSNINASTSTWCQLYLFQSGKIIEESNHFNDFYPFWNFICILFLQTFTSCHLITKMPLLFSWTFSNRHNHSLSITKLKNKSITSGAPKCFSLITNTSDPCNLHFFDKLLVYHNDMFFCGSKMFSVKFIFGSSALSFHALATGWTKFSIFIF